ncbi:hypothetical protein ACH47Z_35825 [Streptomyces sp. NPDC020192]|uniref:hypothetical protein n=1 Tax=Streptomyces sp. NPDC020192 TaxID=3365066 RepID=UPI0037B3E33D
MGLLEGAEVAAHALDVAGETLLEQFAVELGNVVAALVPPLVQAGLVRVQDRGAVDGLDQELVQALARAKRRTVEWASRNSRRIAASDSLAASRRCTASYRSVVRTTSRRCCPGTSSVPSGGSNGSASTGGAVVARGFAADSSAAGGVANTARMHG